MYANSQGTRQSAPLCVVVFGSVNVLIVVDDDSCDVNAPVNVASEAVAVHNADKLKIQ